MPDLIQQRTAGGNRQQGQGHQEGDVQQSKPGGAKGKDNLRRNEMGLELPPKLTLNQFLMKIVVLQLRSHRASCDSQSSESESSLKKTHFKGWILYLLRQPHTVPPCDLILM